jgi:hypothetical protein
MGTSVCPGRLSRWNCRLSSARRSAGSWLEAGHRHTPGGRLREPGQDDAVHAHGADEQERGEHGHETAAAFPRRQAVMTESRARQHRVERRHVGDLTRGAITEPHESRRETDAL